MSPYFTSGTLPAWEFPVRERSRQGDVDSLSGTYWTPMSTVLTAGDAVPGYPGMIIMDLEVVKSGLSRRYNIQAEGSLDNSLAAKRLSRAEARTIGAQFETFTERHLTWLSGRVACTGDAGTDVITTPTPHGMAAGQGICFISLTGGAGLSKQTLTDLAPVYTLTDVTSTTFKLNDSGGSPVNFTTNITAGYFMAADFFPGTTHPDFPAMYLVAANPTDNNTPWRFVDLQYVGKMWDKPYHRVITVAGQVVNSTDKVELSIDGDTNLRYRAVELPEVVVTDTYVDSAALPTGDIPSSYTEGGVPPDAPSIRPLTISGSDDELVYQWPQQWSKIGTQHVETISSAIPLSIYSVVYKYKWPKLPR